MCPLMHMVGAILLTELIINFVHGIISTFIYRYSYSINYLCSLVAFIYLAYY